LRRIPPLEQGRQPAPENVEPEPQRFQIHARIRCLETMHGLQQAKQLDLDLVRRPQGFRARSQDRRVAQPQPFEIDKNDGCERDKYGKNKKTYRQVTPTSPHKTLVHIVAISRVGW
jgi:hypothetical protein